MEEDSTPKRGQLSDPYAKAREILDGISRYRIDRRRVKTTDGGPKAKGGQATVVIGTLIPLQDIPRCIHEKIWINLLEENYAIKMLSWDREDVEGSLKVFKLFVNELSIMSKLSHPNLVKLINFVEDMQNGVAWIILPWEANGNVREFLQSGEWDIPERISLIEDVAEGVSYLHTRQPPICHGDLKSLNILVNSLYHAVITDFGSARRKPHADKREHTTLEGPCYAPDDDTIHDSMSPTIEISCTTLELTLTQPGYSLRWTAPEVLNDQVQDLPSDIWALGWICWEIVTGKIPFEGLYEEGRIVARVVTGKLPAIWEEVQLSHVRKLCGLMSDCWKWEPAGRISATKFRQVVRIMPSITPSACTPGVSKVRSAELLLRLGQMYYAQGNEPMAESHFKSALHVASRTNNHKNEAYAWQGIGGVRYTQSRYPEAEKAFSEAQEIQSRIGNDVGVANALEGLGQTYRHQSRNQDAEKALREAHEIYTRTGSDMNAANALDGLGQIYRTQSKDQEAEKAYREAHEIHSRVGNEVGIANAVQGLGHIYCAQLKYQEAEAAFIEAIAIYSHCGNDFSVAHALVDLGEIYRAQSRYREAEKAFREGREIHSRIGHDRGALHALTKLVEIYCVQWRYDEEEEALKEAFEILSRIDGDFVAPTTKKGLGSACIRNRHDS